ncbi:MAG: ABC transporter ATP-binding protein, partial [Pseudothermotoga sp.]|nr:ABC transporter ATP-binding protein [Pseudothermotoga sp.]
GMNVIELLESMKKELGTTLVVVTHDERIAQRADRILFMRDGRITEVREKENLNNES